MQKMPCISMNYCHDEKLFIILSAVYCKLVKILDCGPTLWRAEWYIFPLSSLGYNLTDAWCISVVYTGSILFSLADIKSSRKMLLLWKVCRVFDYQMFKRLGYDYFYNSKRKKIIFELCNVWVSIYALRSSLQKELRLFSFSE